MKIRKELVVGRFAGAPISLHWSALLAFPIAWAATQSVVAGLVGLFAYLTLIFVHELGHAVIARASGAEVISIELYWLHGLCRIEHPRSLGVSVAIAWGGVAAQFLLLLFALILIKATTVVLGEIPLVLRPLFVCWVLLNLPMIVGNLMPIEPLDGATAWRVIPMLWRQVRRRKQKSKPADPKAAAKVVSLLIERAARRKNR